MYKCVIYWGLVLLLALGLVRPVIADNVQGVSEHNQTVPRPVLGGLESADFDGAPLPNAVTAEGRLVRPKGSLFGVQYIMLVNEDGSAIGTVTIDASYVDDAAFTIGVGRVMASGFLADDTGPDTVNEGDIGLARMSLSRVVRVTPGDDAGTAVTYGAGAVAATTPRTTLASNDPAVVALQVIDNMVHTGDVAVTGYGTIGAVFDDVAPGAVTENQTQSLRMSARRELYSQIRDAAGNERGMNINANNAGLVALDQTTPATTNGVTPVPTANAGAAIAETASAAAEASNILKASAGNLYSITVTTGGTAGYLMVFNATSAPIDGAVTPAYCAQIPANNTAAFEWSIPARYATGITAVFSSTGCFTKTASATAAFFAQVQ